MTPMTTIMSAPNALAGVVHKGLLLGIGAAVVVQENLEGWLGRLAERGALAEAEGREYVRELVAERRQRQAASAPAPTPAPAAARAEAEDEGRAERWVSWCLERLGRPTQRDTRALLERIERLEARIEALRPL